MNAEYLRTLPTIREFFKIKETGELQEGTRLLLEAMTEITIPSGEDVVTFGEPSDDGMYIILEGTTDVLANDGKLINTLGVGDFIGELGLINDDTRGATVRASGQVRCANISKALFDEIAMKNRKIYGSFMNMLYTKTTKLVTEQERIKSELEIATRIQAGCLEDDFTTVNQLPNVNLTARMRPAKEVGGDFYDVFMIDDSHLCFLIADVSGKGVPAALFMSMAKIHIKNYAALGLPLAEVVSRANDNLCYKNEEGMFVTAFVCVLDVETGDVNFVNAGHNLPFISKGNEEFSMIQAKANLVLGLMEGVPYREQHIQLEPGDSIYLYTDGVTEALNPQQQLLGDDYLKDMLNRHRADAANVEVFVQAMYQEVDAFAAGETQADDITMVYLSRK
ncbi:MAG: SpoIIE family protein phosphatase [Lachnospiraceae bacterium]|nr:SpoIIE family protein phosphatase [Lachnospiraceae bacterium]MBP3505237.1 SpoIIE family protein phosphatase [Lachnospiraceae bacterium]